MERTVFRGTSQHAILGEIRRHELLRSADRHAASTSAPPPSLTARVGAWVQAHRHRPVPCLTPAEAC